MVNGGNTWRLFARDAKTFMAFADILVARIESGTTGAVEELLEELLHRLANGPVKWQLSVQLYIDEQDTPVNDASKIWRSTPCVIGELEISSIPSEHDERMVSQMAFNPGNGFDPLGITHARAGVYAASAPNHAGRGLLSSDAARQYLTDRASVAAPSPRSVAPPG